MQLYRMLPARFQGVEIAFQRIFGRLQLARPSKRQWFIDDGDEGLLIDTERGRILARVWRSIDGKTYPELFLSPFDAIRLMLGSRGVVSVTAGFRLTWKVTLFRSKFQSHESGREELLRFCHEIERCFL